MISFADEHAFLLYLFVAALFFFLCVALILRRIRRPERTMRSRYPRFGVFVRWFAAVGMAAVIVVAFARPFTSTPIPVRLEGCADIIVSIDGSVSMLAEDISPDRFEAARRTILALLDESPPSECDRFMFFTFDRISRVKLPLASSSRDRFGREVMRARIPYDLPSNESMWDTDIANALAHVSTVLDLQDEFYRLITGGQHAYSQSVSKSGNKILFFFTDGHDEDLFDDERRARLHEALRELRRRNITVHVIGIGTERGVAKNAVLSRMRMGATLRKKTEEEWAGQRFTLETRSVTHIAATGGGDVFFIRNSRDIARAAAFMKNIVDQERERVLDLSAAADEEHRRELWWYMLLIAALFVLLMI